MVVTFAVFHDAMLPLKVVFEEKRDAMLVTAEVSQVEISPYVAVAVVGSLIHEFTAVPILLSVIAVVSVRTVVSLDKERSGPKNLIQKRNSNKKVSRILLSP